MRGKLLCVGAPATATGVSAQMMDGYGQTMMGGWFFGGIFQILYAALIIAAIYWLYKSANRKK